MNEFTVGDLVVMKSGSPCLTITGELGGEIGATPPGTHEVAWYWGGALHRAFLPAKALRYLSASELEASGLVEKTPPAQVMS